MEEGTEYCDGERHQRGHSDESLSGATYLRREVAPVLGDVERGRRALGLAGCERVDILARRVRNGGLDGKRLNSSCSVGMRVNVSVAAKRRLRDGAMEELRRQGLDVLGVACW